MKNLKQLVLPCYKLEMAMPVEAWHFLHGSTDGVCNLTYLLSLLSKMAVSEVMNTKRGLSYAIHPGQADGSSRIRHTARRSRHTKGHGYSFSTGIN